MIYFDSVSDFIIVFVALVAAGCALIPYVPRWVGYALDVGLAFYGIFLMTREGVNAKNVALVVIFALLAADTWYRHLRRRPGPPKAKPARP